MSWRQDQQQFQQAASQHQSQQGHIVLLLAGSLLAPFTLLTCLTLYKLSERRQAKPEADPHTVFRRSAARQVTMVTWLAVAAAFMAAGVNFAVLRDRSIQIAPGDQRLIRLGGWAGLCGVVALDADTPLKARVVGPGLARAQWPVEAFKRDLSGRIISGDLRAAWEMPALGLGRIGRLKVEANFRHRVRLVLLRRLGEEGPDQQRQLNEKEIELVDDVGSINAVTVYNLTLPGRLSLRLTNLDSQAAGTANFTFSVALTAWRFDANSSSAVGASHVIDCRLGQETCRLDNPAAWMILQVLPSDPGDLASSGAALQSLRVICEQLLPIAKTAPVVLALLVCLPCILLLIADAALAGHCWMLTTSRAAGQQKRSSLASPGGSGRGKQLEVRFQLDNTPVEKY